MRRREPERPTSYMGPPTEAIASAQDLRKEEAELRNYTRNLGRVGDVLSLIGQIPENKGKDVVAKKPNTKSPGKQELMYVNEQPKLPTRPPPKIDSPKSDKKNKKDKKDKKEDKKGDKKKDKAKESIANYDALNHNAEEAIYEEFQPDTSYCYVDAVSMGSHDSGSGEYLEPVERRGVTTSLDAMSVDDVCDVLKRLDLGQHKKKFKKEKVSGLLLKRFDDKVLIDDFSFRKVEAIKLMAYIETGHIPK